MLLLYVYWSCDSYMLINTFLSLIRQEDKNYSSAGRNIQICPDLMAVVLVFIIIIITCYRETCWPLSCTTMLYL